MAEAHYGPVLGGAVPHQHGAVGSVAALAAETIPAARAGRKRTKQGGLSVKVSTGSVQIKKSARNQPCQPGSFQGQMEEWQHLSGGIKDS